MTLGRAQTRHDDEQIRELYPQMGPDGLAAILPHRSRQAIIRRACQLRVRYLGPVNRCPTRSACAAWYTSRPSAAAIAEIEERKRMLLQGEL